MWETLLTLKEGGGKERRKEGRRNDLVTPFYQP